MGGSAVAVGLFMLASVNISHGVYALIVLPLCAVALALWGGPEQLARRVTVTSEAVGIDRFNRVRTVVERAELEEATARMETSARGRSRAVLVLDPIDPEVFFGRHRELRAGRRGDLAVVPTGRNAGTVTELSEALTALRPSSSRP